MLKQYDPETARQTILKRTPPDEFPVSQQLLDGIAEIFGERLSPDAAVTQILKDVRMNGDSALQKWTERLDGLDLEPVPVSQTAIQSAWDSISREQRDALKLAATRIEAFHRRQPLASWFINELGGTLGSTGKEFDVPKATSATVGTKAKKMLDHNWRQTFDTPPAPMR